MKLLLLLAFVASAYSAYFEPGDMKICYVFDDGDVHTYDGIGLLRNYTYTHVGKTVISSWEENRNDPCKFSVVAYTDQTKEYRNNFEWVSLSIGVHPANDCKFLANVRIERNRIVWRQHGKKSVKIEPPFNFMSEDGCNHLSLNEEGPLLIRSKTCQYGLTIYRQYNYMYRFDILVGVKYAGGMDGLCRNGDGLSSNDVSMCFSGNQPVPNREDVAQTCKAPRPKPDDCGRSNPPTCEAPCDLFDCSSVCPFGWRNVFVDECAVGCDCDGCPHESDLCYGDPTHQDYRCYGEIMVRINHGPFKRCRCRCPPCSEGRCAKGMLIPSLEEICKDQEYANVHDLLGAPSTRSCSCPCDAATK